MGGPIWSAPMHDQDWVLSILENVKSMQERYPAYEKILAVLTTISEVLFAAHSEFFFSISLYLIFSLFRIQFFLDWDSFKYYNFGH